MKAISKIFGEGTIVSQDSENVTVNFNGIIKTLVIKFARLTNEDGTAFGVAFEAKGKNQMSDKKRSEKYNITSKGTLTEEQKVNLEIYMNNKKWGSKSW